MTSSRFRGVALALLLALAAAPQSFTTVAILPGTSIQTVVNANPAGTTYILKAGTHVQQDVKPKTGDTFRGEGNLATIMDGQNVAVRAFRGYNGSAWVNNVTIKNLAVTRYNPPAQSAAVWAGDDTINATNAWVLDSLDVHHNANLGIRVGNHTQVLRSATHHNTTLGIGGAGKGVLIEGLVSTFNNNGCVNNPGFESGGSKFVETDSLEVRYSTFSDNCGVGLWLDILNRNYLLHDNVAERNYREGIATEVSHKGKIYDNFANANGWPVDPFRANGWLWDAGIAIHASDSVEVYGNTVYENFNGIVIIQQVRDVASGDSYAPPGAFPTGGFVARGNYIHDNAVYQRVWSSGNNSATGAADDTPQTGGSVFTRGNVWANNRYYFGATGVNPNPFSWLNAYRSVSAWKGYGQDVSAPVYP